MSNNTFRDDIQQINNGFRFESVHDESRLSFLRETNSGWHFEHLDRSGYSFAKCKSMEDFIQILTTEIAPRISENANDLRQQLEKEDQQLKNKNIKLNKEILNVKQQLIDENFKLNEEIDKSNKRVFELARKNANLNNNVRRLSCGTKQTGDRLQ